MYNRGGVEPEGDEIAWNSQNAEKQNLRVDVNVRGQRLRVPEREGVLYML